MILQKTVVRSFHRQNAGLYLVILLFAGSFMSGREHIALARVIMSRPDLLLMASALWVLATTQTILFLASFLRLPTNEFLFDIGILPNSKKWKELIMMQIGLNSLPLTYSVIWFVIGWAEQHYFSVFCLFVIHLLLIVLPVYRANWLFSKPNRKQNDLVNPFLVLGQNSGWRLHFTTYLLRYQGLYLFLQKAFAVLLLTGIALLYPSDNYDVRLFRIGVLLVASGYFTFGQRFQQFYNAYYQFVRNLPISNNLFFKWMIINALQFILIEILLIIVLFPLRASWFVWVDTSVFLLSVALFWQVSSFRFQQFTTRTQHLIFLAHALTLVLIMFGLPLLVLAVGVFIYSWQILKTTYAAYQVQRMD